MDANWAAEHLQTIRTLMERSAIYRRALAPVMIFVGAVGTIAAAVGWKLAIVRPVAFTGFWYLVGTVALIGAFLMVRRQAFQQSEPFWSPPTRRVAQAMLPPLTAGFCLGLLAGFAGQQAEGRSPEFADWTIIIALLWVVLYGCAIHAAGFFMPRGMNLFGWVVIIGGCGGFFLVRVNAAQVAPAWGHAIMGLVFGVLQLAYGSYLYFTEPRRNDS